MAVTQFQPTSDFFRPLIEDFLRPPAINGRGLLRAPEADVLETQNAILVVLDAPGMTPADIELSLENNVLTVSGERRSDWSDGENNQHTWHLAERRYGKFSRSFVLPRDVDQERIEARFENGVLAVTVPKSERTRRRRIEINGGQDANSGSRLEAGNAS